MWTRLSLTVLLCGMLCTHAFGQSAGAFVASSGNDLSGNWSPAPHDELVGNPALVEYYGVPINEGARLGPCVELFTRHAAGTPVPGPSGFLHLRRAAEPAHLGRQRSAV